MRKSKLKVVIAQINPIVGDIDYNAKKIIHIIRDNQDCDIIVFPEMALVGYPIMDHIHDPLIKNRNHEFIEKIKETKSEATIILGTFTEPEELEGKIQPFYNSAIVIENNEMKACVNKRLLPNYDVFDERRYFSFDDKYNPVEIKGYIIYVNIVGGLDEIVYDGQSFITNKFGQMIFKAKAFEEDICLFEVPLKDEEPIEEKKYNTDWREEVINALNLNLYDYYNKSGIFDGVVLGLSGGIDSAFTAYICVKALGSDKITAVMMPTKFTSKDSINLARSLCGNLNIKYIIHPIDDLFNTYGNNLENNLGKIHFDIADENLQARIRANILMYYSNKFNWLLVSTGNKSEIGVGYCTLYGDTCGGKNVPGDLLKTQIYDICDWINKEKEIIPKGIIERPPTAELRENQKDSDSLPPYKILDVILEEIFENGIGSEFKNLKSKGYEPDTVNKVRKLYLNSEFKRRQLVQTIKVSESAFGIGRRYPVLKKLKF